MTGTKTTAIVQARMGSSRFPGKVLKNLAGRPVLTHVLERLSYCRLLDEILVATTRLKEDDAIEELCGLLDRPCYRGSVDDLLDRYYRAAQAHQADPIIRVTADCPLIDPEVVDETIKGYFDGGWEVFSLDGSFPDGLDCGLFSFAVLEDSWTHASLPSEREHVGPYMFKHPEKYRAGTYRKFENLGHYRWTLDEEEDYQLLGEIFDRLYLPNKIFLTKDVLDLLERDPQLIRINAHIPRNEGLKRSLEKDDTFLHRQSLKESQVKK